jgi:hypothetical protein
MTERRQVKLEYKLSHRPMGVFQIRNSVNEKVFIDSSLNIPGKLNRHKFQLNAGVHPSKELQSDWNELGPDKFDFEVLEPMEPREQPDFDYGSDLVVLEDLWLEKLSPYDGSGYNTRKKTREERLQMIASRTRENLS